MANYGKRADGTTLRTQWETIDYYLSERPGRTITQWMAIRDFGFTRLSAIIYLIQERTGKAVSRRRVHVTTRYGAKVLITEYFYENQRGGDNR